MDYQQTIFYPSEEGVIEIDAAILGYLPDSRSTSLDPNQGTGARSSESEDISARTE